MAVLASSNNIPLLWTAQSRPTLPCFLPPAILAAPRRIIRPIPRALRLATPLRHGVAPDNISLPLAPIPRHRAVLESGLHLEPPQPGNPSQLLGSLGLHGAVSSLGAYGIQSCCPWRRAQR